MNIQDSELIYSLLYLTLKTSCIYLVWILSIPLYTPPKGESILFSFVYTKFLRVYIYIGIHTMYIQGNIFYFILVLDSDSLPRNSPALKEG